MALNVIMGIGPTAIGLTPPSFLLIPNKEEPKKSLADNGTPPEMTKLD